jgi:hypothetical protein
MDRIRQRFGGRTAGMRTPWYCRSAQLFEVLSAHFSYDSSVPNSSSFFSASSNSGCCTVFPYRPTADLFELPMTLPPDTAGPAPAVYERMEPICEQIVENGGVIVATLHPQPHQSAHPEGIEHWVGFLGRIAARYGERLWRATPAEIVERYRAAIDPSRARPARAGASPALHAG